MIYHICPPDSLFLKSLINRFEQIKPGFNRCVIIVSAHHKNPKINLDKNLIEFYGCLNNDIITKIWNSDCQGVVVHTLNDDILELALNLSKRYPVIWRSWGPDLHDILYKNEDLLLPHTKRIVTGGGKIYQSYLKHFRQIYHTVSGKEKLKNDRIEKKKEFIKSVGYIATTTFNEFRLLRERIHGMNAEYLPLNYRSLDIAKLPDLQKDNSGKKIMISHSSYSYHNHADVLYYLKNDSYQGPIVIPLNYGDTVYRDKIVDYGSMLFGKQLEFTTEYTNFPDYLNFITGCYAFVHNSKVQSGGGNIMYFLHKGSNVYLREENPIYQDYKELGVKLFSVQKDLSSGQLIQENLSLQDKITNRNIIESRFNSEKEKSYVIDVYRKLNIAI